ncbi:MAG: M1 family metallopeptidase [Bacteroidales bacterium]|nr:M1 family metallopeptidase [Bacteroidales bacterium]
MMIRLKVPKGYTAVSNGTLKKQFRSEAKYDQFEWFVSYPINNYNVTFYLGKFEYFSDSVEIQGDNLLLKYYVLPYNLEKAKTHFEQSKQILKAYSKFFGKYPFMRDGFGLVESPYEGMEHQTAIAYGNSYSNVENNTYRKKEFDYIIVHEAAHEWWGNAVSAVDMADIWIHEGFATYAEFLLVEDVYGKDEYNYEINQKRKFIFNFWPVVENYDVNENSFASNDVYTKGAMILHCLRSTINNDSLFFKIIRDFFKENEFNVVTTQQFIDLVNQSTGKNFTPFFKK